MTTQTVPAGGRLLFLDQLRGWAVIVMIEVHVFGEWLRPDIKLLAPWSILNFVNTLVAPTFIFVSGFVIAITTTRKWDEYTRVGGVFANRIRHLVLILAVGYLLRAPVATLSGLLAGPNPGSILVFLRVDVLHCIAIGALLVHALILVLRKQNLVIAACIVLGAGFLFIAPLMLQSPSLDSLPLWFENYLNKRHGSLFPLFPWAAYMMFGTVTAFLFMRAQIAGRSAQFLLRAAIAGIFVSAAGLVLHFLPISTDSPVIAWRTVYEYTLVRMGIVPVLIFVAYRFESRGKPGPLLVTKLGRESLIMYSLHLVLLYGSITGISIAAMWKGHCDYAASFAGYVALLAVTGLVALGWNFVKSRSRPAAKWISWGLLVLLTLVFVFR
jgi:uncharacterized membrane protein